MDPIERLAAIFANFPGIGPRQAQRFVQFLLRASPSARRDLAEAIRELGGSVRQCPQCFRFHAEGKPTCRLCADDARASSLAVVASDADLSALERSGSFRGRYFVLGGTLSLASEKTTGLRLPQLRKRIEDGAFSEVILAFPANPEGDATAIRVREEISASFPALRLTSLGRGLSTGSELEYADAETIRHALDSRK